MNLYRICARTADIYRSPGIKRAAKSAIPLAVATGILAAGYKYCPQIHDSIDYVREMLNRAPAFDSRFGSVQMHISLSEAISSGAFMGGGPDFLAQRYSGEKFSFKRLLLMTVLGGISGTVSLRTYYNYINAKIPGDTFWINEGKIAIDQVVYSPIYLCFYLAATNLIKGGRWNNFVSSFWTNCKTIMPKSWAFWWLFGAQVIYFSPMDLRIYWANILSLFWFSILSNYAHRPATNP